MNWPRDNDAELDAFYSRPDGSAKWEVTNLTYIFPPWKAYLAGTNLVLSHGIRVHRKVAASLESILASLWETFGKSQTAIEKADLHQIGGAYYFRARRGSKRLSNHARGIAIDIDPQDNPMRKGGPRDMDPRVVAAFEKEGWRWGAQFNDPMHFEAVFNGKPAKPQTATPAPVPVKPVVLNPFIANAATLALIKPAEKFMAEPYSDLGAPAIGYGHRILPGETFTKITEPQAHDILLKDLAKTWAWLSPCITVKLNTNQIGALLAFGMNNKPAKVKTSTLLRLLNAGDFKGAADQFPRWNRGDGRVLPGLVKRREAERQLFIS